MSKAKKIIFVFVSSVLLVCLLCFSVSANTYSFSHDNILNSNTVLSVTNGKDYFRFYRPSLCNNFDDYSVCQWVIKDYSPPQDDSHSSLSTNVYLRLDQLNGIYVNKGQRLTITFEIAYDGTIDYNEYLTTRLKLQGWENVSPRQYIGAIPKGNKTKVVFIWDNTIGEASIQYFDINFSIKNNKPISNDYLFEWFYGNLDVNVGEIPLNNKDIIENQDENTDKIIENQEQNTAAIIDHQNEMYEKEKAEIDSTGNDSVDSVTEIIPSDNEGFINALGQLSSCLVSSSTQARWNFPRVYIPAIPNVFEKEVELIPATKIDFNFWVNKIPSTILTIVRTLCTLALLIYCFKELYGHISYVMTLKRGE